MIIPGLPRYRPLTLGGFKPVTFTNSGTFVVPAGVEQVRLVAKGRDAVGTWVPWSQNILRMTRSVSTSGTGLIADAWVIFMDYAGAELLKFQGLSGTNGSALTFSYRTGTVDIRYPNSSSATLPVTSNPATLTSTSRTWRFRNGGVSAPNFAGRPIGLESMTYGNWPSSPLIWEASAQRYEFVGYGGDYRVNGSASGSLLRFEDPSSAVPQGSAVTTWPVVAPSITIASVSTEIVSVVPGETLTLSFPSGAVADRYIRIEMV